MTGGVSAQEQGRVFDANRARGRIAFAVGSQGGMTRRTAVHEDGSLRIRFPNTEPGQCEAIIVNTAGGIAGGDRYQIEAEAAEGSRLVVSGAAAEKIYRTHGPDAEIATKLTVGEHASLCWLPQETILFDRARLSRSIEIDLAATASAVLVEPIVFGRAAMGEAVMDGKIVDRWRVRREGRLIYADTFRIDGAVKGGLASRACTGGGTAIATLLAVPGDDNLAVTIRAMEEQFAGEVGVSCWNGILLARFCARDGAAMRRDLIAVLASLGRRLPRLWLN